MQISQIYDPKQTNNVQPTQNSNHAPYRRDSNHLSNNIPLWAPCSAFTRAMLDTIEDGILICRQGGHIEWCNHMISELLGYDRLNLMNKNVSTLVTSSALNMQNITQSLVHCNHSVEQVLELNVKHQTGTHIPVKFTMRKIVENDNFVIILKDLRQQKKAEEALRTEHEKLKITIEHAPMGIVTYHPNQCILSANKAFSQITGYQTNELFELTIDQIIHPDDIKERTNLIENALQQELPRATHRYRYIHKNGDILYVQVVFGFTHDANGQVDLIIAEVQDLTPQLKAEAQANLNLMQLAHASRLSTLGEMVAGIAHELNQPLTAISLFSQAGKRLFDNNDLEKIADIFDKLTLHSQRAGGIIQRMQSMATLEQNDRKATCPNALLTDIAKLAEIEARLRNITIKVAIDNNLPTLTVDIVQIQQVALNLLRNGMEAMHAIGCKHGNIITLSSYLTAEGLIEIAVYDLGCGVSTMAASNLFTPFVTTKKSGMGLGLSICKSIINAHGGHISYRNNPSHGATFYFTLPTN